MKDLLKPIICFYIFLALFIWLLLFGVKSNCEFKCDEMGLKYSKIETAEHFKMYCQCNK